jgi:hypothetical protein
MLIEVLVLVLATVSIGGLLLVTVNDVLYLQRTAAARANRVATIASLTRQLRGDLLVATAYRWDGPGRSVQLLEDLGMEATAADWEGATLTLEVAGAGERSAVYYLLAGDSVRRRAAGGGRPQPSDAAAGASAGGELGVETHVWQATRLQLAAWREQGERGDLLWIEFLELPAPRCRTATPRRSCLCLMLPHYVVEEGS